MKDPSAEAIHKVAIYVLDEDPEPRLIQLRNMAAQNGWKITNEFVDRIPAAYILAGQCIEIQVTDEMRAFKASMEADHACAHDATLSWAGPLQKQPRVIVNRHRSYASGLIDESDPLAVMCAAQEGL